MLRDVDWGFAPDDCKVSLFEVWNTSDRKLYVLARDKNKAFSIAHCAGHIRVSYQRWGWEIHDEKYIRDACQISSLTKVLLPWEIQIREAIASRKECTLIVSDQNIRIGFQSFYLHKISK
jgi:hypothetical protein